MRVIENCDCVLHHCVLILFCSWIVYCSHLKIDFRSCSRNVSGVASIITTSVQLLINKTEAAIFPCRFCFLREFPFLSLIY